MASTTDYFYTTAPTGSPDSVAACNKLLGHYFQHPYNFEGPKEGFEAKAVEEGLFVRVDIPGVEDEELDVSLQNDTVFLKAQARKYWDQEKFGRLYCGTIHLLPYFGKKVAILKNGVLTMVLDACGFRPNFSATTIAQFSNNNFEFPTGWTRIRDYLLLNKRFLLLNPPDKYICYYPFKVSGVNGAYEAMVVDSEKFVLRADLPGVEKDELCHKFSNRAVLYAADNMVSEHNEQRRYFGSFSLKCDCCNITDVKLEVKAGVLRMLVSKEKI